MNGCDGSKVVAVAVVIFLVVYCGGGRGDGDGEGEGGGVAGGRGEGSGGGGGGEGKRGGGYDSITEIRISHYIISVHIKMIVFLFSRLILYFI